LRLVFLNILVGEKELCFFYTISNDHTFYRITIGLAKFGLVFRGGIVFFFNLITVFFFFFWDLRERRKEIKLKENCFNLIGAAEIN